MGKRSKTKHTKAIIQDSDDSETMLRMLIDEQGEGTPEASFSSGNYFDDLAQDSGNEEEIIEEEKRELIRGDCCRGEEVRKEPVFALIPPQKPHQAASVSISNPPIDQLLRQISDYKAVLEEKKSRLKDALQEKDELLERSKRSAELQTKLVNALVKVDELEEKLSRRKEKYRAKLEEAERFLVEKNQMKKAEVYSQHIQKQKEAISKQNEGLRKIHA